MMTSDEDDDAEMDDSEFSDDTDVQDENESDDASESETVPCPFCGKPVYEGADVCPKCGNFIALDAVSTHRRAWIIAGGVAALAGAAGWFLLRS